MNRAWYTPSSPSFYNSLWQNMLLLAAWGTATEIWHIAQKLLVQQAERLLGCAVGLTHQRAIQPDSSSKDLLPAVTSSHIWAPHEITGWLFYPCICVCVVAVRERVTKLYKDWEWVSTATLHPEPFAVCHVLCLGLKSLPGVPSLQIICVMGMYLRMKEFMSQIHRWTLLRLQSNWV